MVLCEDLSYALFWARISALQRLVYNTPRGDATQHPLLDTKMNGAHVDGKRIPLQELRRIQRTLPDDSNDRSKGISTSGCSGVRTPTCLKNASEYSIRKLEASKTTKGTKKPARSSSSKGPREFSCRRQAPVYGAVVTAEDEGKSPLLITSSVVNSVNVEKGKCAEAVTPEVAAYRQAAANLCLKRLRGGLGKSGSGAQCRDPRFSDLCGDLNLTSCSRAYAFIDEQQQLHERMLQQVVRTGRLPPHQGELLSNGKSGKSKGRKATFEERQQAEHILQQVKSQQQQRQRKAAEVALRSELSKKEREAIALTGKRVHYCSRKRFRQLLQKKQEQQRSAKGKVKAEIQKSKKLLANERRKKMVPSVRRVAVV